jgi:hypothetical protein
MNPKTDAEIIAWFRKVRRYDSYTVSREQARKDVKGALPPSSTRTTALACRPACCRCWPASRREGAGHAQVRRAATRARSKSSAFR